MQLICKKITAAVLAFLMIISIGNGVMHPLAQVNDTNTQNSSKSEVKTAGNDDVLINEENFPDKNFRN